MGLFLSAFPLLLNFPFPHFVNLLSLILMRESPCYPIKRIFTDAFWCDDGSWIGKVTLQCENRPPQASCRSRFVLSSSCLPAPCFRSSTTGSVGVASSSASSFGSVSDKVDERRDNYVRKQFCSTDYNKKTAFWHSSVSPGSWPLVGIISLQGRASGVIECWYTRAERQPTNTK